MLPTSLKYLLFHALIPCTAAFFQRNPSRLGCKRRKKKVSDEGRNGGGGREEREQNYVLNIETNLGLGDEPWSSFSTKNLLDRAK